MDFTAFSAAAPFDSCAWVNALLAEHGAAGAGKRGEAEAPGEQEEALEAALSAASMQLQIVAQELGDDLEKALAQLAGRVPRVLAEVSAQDMERRVQALQDDVRALSASQQLQQPLHHAGRHTTAQAQTPPDAAAAAAWRAGLANLEQLDVLKGNMERCRDTLEEAVHWRRVAREARIDAASASVTQLKTAARRVQALRKAAEILKAMPEHEQRLETIQEVSAEILQRLRPHLLEDIKGLNTAALRAHLRIYELLGSENEIIELYAVDRSEQVHELWERLDHDFGRSGKSGRSFRERFVLFHQQVLAALSDEARRCQMLFEVTASRSRRRRQRLRKKKSSGAESAGIDGHGDEFGAENDGNNKFSDSADSGHESDDDDKSSTTSSMSSRSAHGLDRDGKPDNGDGNDDDANHDADDDGSRGDESAGATTGNDGAASDVVCEIIYRGFEHLHTPMAQGLHDMEGGPRAVTDVMELTFGLVPTLARLLDGAKAAAADRALKAFVGGFLSYVDTAYNTGELHVMVSSFIHLWQGFMHSLGDVGPSGNTATSNSAADTATSGDIDGGSKMGEAKDMDAHAAEDIFPELHDTSTAANGSGGRHAGGMGGGGSGGSGAGPPGSTLGMDHDDAVAARVATVIEHLVQTGARIFAEMEAAASRCLSLTCGSAMRSLARMQAAVLMAHCSAVVSVIGQLRKALEMDTLNMTAFPLPQDADKSVRDASDQVLSLLRGIALPTGQGLAGLHDAAYLDAALGILLVAAHMVREAQTFENEASALCSRSFGLFSQQQQQQLQRQESWGLDGTVNNTRSVMEGRGGAGADGMGRFESTTFSEAMFRTGLVREFLEAKGSNPSEFSTVRSFLISRAAPADTIAESSLTVDASDSRRVAAASLATATSPPGPGATPSSAAAAAAMSSAGRAAFLPGVHGPLRDVKDLCLRFVYDVCMAIPIKRMAEYWRLASWTRGGADDNDDDGEAFASVSGGNMDALPQETITQVGDHMLSLVQQLENFASSEVTAELMLQTLLIADTAAMSAHGWNSMTETLVLSEVEKQAMPTFSRGGQEVVRACKALAKQINLPGRVAGTDALQELLPDRTPGDHGSSHNKQGAENDDEEEEEDAGAAFANAWLTCIASATMGCLVGQIGKINELTAAGCQQLVADLTYLEKVCDALEITPHPAVLYLADVANAPADMLPALVAEPTVPIAGVDSQKEIACVGLLSKMQRSIARSRGALVTF